MAALSRQFLAIAVAAGTALPAHAQDSANSLRETYAALHRVSSIAARVFKENIHACPKTRFSYGFTHVATSRSASLSTQALWKAAFSAEDVPTVIFVDPEGPAARAGLQVADLIISVNGHPWPEQPAEQTHYVEALAAAKNTQPDLTMSVRRNGRDMSIKLTADLTCDIKVNLVASERLGAFAGNETISMTSETNKLLSDDGEMAFVIAHELAHVVRGHAPAKADSIGRQQMELDADELGIAFLLRAGYGQESAASAIRKLDAASRGPLTRVFGVYGPYLPTDKRIEFLNGAANKAAKTMQPAETPTSK